MNQIRFQPLNEAYQQLSTLLCNTALNIQTTDYTSPQEWARLIQQVKQTCAVFKSHAEKEEDLLFPLLHNYEPALVAILRDNQCNRMRYLNALSELFTGMQAANDKQKSKLFSHKLLYRFDEFVASVLQQLNEQERMINAVLWRYYSDKELAGIAASFLLTPLALSHKKDTSFADNLIKNIPPAAIHSHTRINNGCKPHRATKELALAI